MADHKDLTTTDLHEPKAVAAANADELYVADGAASGDWKKITETSIDSTAAAGATDVLVADGANGAGWVTFTNLHRIAVSTGFADISSAGTDWFVMPFAGDIETIYTVIHNSITVADCGITFKIGGVEITNSAITVTQSGSAAGDVDTSTPSGANTVTAGQAVEIITDGNSGTVTEMHIVFVLDVS